MPRKPKRKDLCNCGEPKPENRKKCRKCSAAYMRRWRQDKVLIPYDALCDTCKSRLFQ